MDQRLSSVCSCERHCSREMKMIPAVILICIATTVTSAPTSQYTINVDGPEGRHVQMGEPGKAVSGYYTSRSLDGLMEYKTNYEADDKGYRATGDHLPVAAVLPAVRSLDSAPEGYVFKYEAPGGHSHYMMGQPGKSVQGSFTYVDAEGRSQRVDYEADEKGYRVLPIKEEETPIAIASVSADAEVVIAAGPVIPVAAEPIPEIVAEPIPEIVAEPITQVVAEPVVAAPVPEAVAEPVVVAVAAAADPAPKPVVVEDPSSRTILATEEKPVEMMYYQKDTGTVEAATRTISEEEKPAVMMYYPKDAEVAKEAEPATRTIPEEEKPAYMMYYIKDAGAVEAAEPASRTIPEEQPAAMMYYPNEAEVAKEAEPASRTIPEEQPAAMMYYPKDAGAVEAAEPASRTIPEEQPVAMMYYPKDAEVAEPSSRTIQGASEAVAEPAPAVKTVASDPAPAQPVAESTQSNTQGKAVYALPIALPGATYYGLPARFVQPALPAFHYAAPYAYAYGYNVGYPLTGGSYVYTH
ncbi:translation initiation factor IF-2-like isoform X1 [Daphnia pulicaria]|uniref:translation initiation factor IF-2-like isoform X1 n=1 Tax=Daphnia pulicaria TaxID=35523 RepID=UPI001EEA4A5B|nr:translation initiation factor IF-2-like isoform X1 [Daphnia pulicaria]